jgi:hypothetical protein
VGARAFRRTVEGVGRPVPQCPIRLGEPCSLCEPGVTGPEDCGLVWLVMTDPDLRERLADLRREAAAAG